MNVVDRSDSEEPRPALPARQKERGRGREEKGRTREEKGRGRNGRSKEREPVSDYEKIRERERELERVSVRVLSGNTIGVGLFFIKDISIYTFRKVMLMNG